jgi:hypothetical protein
MAAAGGPGAARESVEAFWARELGTIAGAHGVDVRSVKKIAKALGPVYLRMLERFGKANILNVLSVEQEAVPVAIYKFLASRSPVMSCCGVRTYVRTPSNAIRQFFWS